MLYKPYIRDLIIFDNFLDIDKDIEGYIPKYIHKDMNKKENREDRILHAIRPDSSPQSDVVIKVISDNNVTKPVINNNRGSSIRFKSKDEFKNTMLPIYESVLVSRGLNPVFANALVAQDGLESAWGSKPSGKFNYGGIKGKGTTRRTREVIDGKDVYINDTFKDFNSLYDYAKAKVDLLNNKRYDAFGGSIDEFASRVARGGYATDPRYENVLNRIIQYSKQGGILKYEEGGINYGVNWTKNWYTNRGPQLLRNYRFHAKLPGFVNEKTLYHNLNDNIDSTSIEINPSKLGEGIEGSYRPKEHAIYLRSNDVGNIIHEVTHSSIPIYQVKEIDHIKDIFGDGAYFDQFVKPSEYWDNSEEIYARMMSFREWAEKECGFGPDHTWTVDDIEKLQNKYIVNRTLLYKDRKIVFDNKGKILSNEKMDLLFPDEERDPMVITNISVPKKAREFLDRYNAAFLVRLLNDVAQNSDNKKDKRSSVYAKLGLKVPYANTYDDPNEYYDYRQNNYNPSNDHWYSRDSKTGIELKHPKHPTAFMSHELDKAAGYKRYQDADGRYYTLPEWSANLEPTYFFKKKEVGYPTYGKKQLTMEDSINDNMPRVKYMYDELKKGGASDAQAAAILGNWYAESQLQYDAINSNSKASGLAQLLGSRKKAYEEYLKSNGKQDSTESQISYLVPIIFGTETNPHNLTNPYTYTSYKTDANGNSQKVVTQGAYNVNLQDWTKKQQQQFLNGKDLNDLVSIFMNNFERPSAKEKASSIGKRQQAAKYILDLMSK